MDFRARNGGLALLLTTACCGLLAKKGGGDAGADAGGDAAVAVAAVEADAAPATPPALAPVNAGDVARFADEVPVANEPATVARASNARVSPPAGTVVQQLVGGTHVTKIASRPPQFLVTFDNAQATTSMGWLHETAFVAPTVDAGAPTLRCANGEVALMGDIPFCGKVCAADKDCQATQACSGQARKLTKARESVSVCNARATASAAPVPVRPQASAAATAPPPAATTVAAAAAPAPTPPPPPANLADMSPRDRKMAECNQLAGTRQGADRTDYIKTCLSASHPAAQTELMKKCNLGATGLVGDARKSFMKDCLTH